MTFGDAADADGRARRAGDVPWFAWPVPAGERNPALRPVTEDEVEELDDVGPDDDWITRAEPPVPWPVAGAAEVSAFAARELGRALKARRWELHLNQRAYARRTGRAQGTVSKLERGLVALSLRDFVELALEAGRVVRLVVEPEGTVVDLDREQRLVVPVGVGGSVRLAVGPRTPRAAAWRGFGPPPGPIS